MVVGPAVVGWSLLESDVNLKHFKKNFEIYSSGGVQ
jgi:hypothetical protein